MDPLLDGIRDVAEANVFWVGWNLFLAFLPWALAVVLFNPRWRRVGIGWLAGASVCLLFLPNAAYVLTDIIHVPRLVRAERSDAVVLLAVLPMFAALFVLGFLAYVDILRRMSGFAVGRGWLRSAWPIVLAVHAVSAVAIYAGRIHRFNSWDMFDRPEAVLGQTLEGFTEPLVVAGMAFTFVVLTIGYAIARPLLQAASDRLRASFSLPEPATSGRVR